MFPQEPTPFSLNINLNLQFFKTPKGRQTSSSSPFPEIPNFRLSKPGAASFGTPRNQKIII